MRYILYPILALTIFAGCEKSPQSIFISGQIDDYNGERAFLYSSNERYGYRDWTSSLDTTDISADGTFSFSFEADKPDFYQVVGDEGFPLFRDIFLAPGDSIDIHVPVRSDSTRVTFSGSSANAYRIDDMLDSLWRNEPSFQSGYYEIAQMEMDSALSFLKERYDKKISVMNDHFEGHPEWGAIEQQSRDAIMYRSAQEHYDYLYYHKYYTQDTFLYLIPDSGYYSFLDPVDISSPPEYFSYNYLFLMRAFLRDHFQRDNYEMDDSLMYANQLPLMIETAKKHLDGEARDWAFLSIASDFSHYLSNDDFFELVDSMENYLSSNHTSDAIMAHFRHIKSEYEKLRPGHIAPELALPNVNGDTVRLSDQKGKVVYLDFWGTWCYPCLQELPHSLELEEKFDGDAVEFIYVGLQSGEDQLLAWKEFILGERGLDYAPFLEQRVYPGIHLLSEGQFNNPALKPFKIGAAPTYMLIDAQGKIVSANAPRPSSDKIEELIRETLAGI